MVLKLYWFRCDGDDDWLSGGTGLGFELGEGGGGEAGDLVWREYLMAAVNPQPLQARPFEEHGRGPIPIEDDEAEYEDGGDDGMEDMEEVHVNSVSVAERGGGGGGGGVVMASRTSELTLSFEGEVYVFPAVTPEKVSLSHFHFLKYIYCNKNLFFFFPNIHFMPVRLYCASALYYLLRALSYWVLYLSSVIAKS